MGADCDFSEDEISPNPHAHPTFPSLHQLFDTSDVNNVSSIPNMSFSGPSDDSTAPNTTTLSRSSLQDCSVVSIPGRDDSEQTNSYINRNPLLLYQQTVAANIDEKRHKFTNELTEEEKRRGFRLNNFPDPRYLGFTPNSHDRRKYLTAMPVASFKSPSHVGFYLPVPTSQKIVLFVFVLIVLLLSAASAYFFRSMIVGDIVLNFRKRNA